MMARPFKRKIDRAWYHVLNGGAGRRVVFTTDEQRNSIKSRSDPLYSSSFVPESHGSASGDL